MEDSKSSLGGFLGGFMKFCGKSLDVSGHSPSNFRVISGVSRGVLGEVSGLSL